MVTEGVLDVDRRGLRCRYKGSEMSIEGVLDVDDGVLDVDRRGLKCRHMTRAPR